MKKPPEGGSPWFRFAFWLLALRALAHGLLREGTMAEQFKVGDTVRLKSGGPTMTITAVGDDNGKIRVWCSWFDAMNEKNASFPADALEAH